jgi:hypothetical protein
VRVRVSSLAAAQQSVACCCAGNRSHLTVQWLPKLRLVVGAAAGLGCEALDRVAAARRFRRPAGCKGGANHTGSSEVKSGRSILFDC